MRLGRWIACVLSAIAVVAPSSAEEPERRIRAGLFLGAYSARDELRSDAANVLTLLDEQNLVFTFFTDPRADELAGTRLEVEGAAVATLGVEVALTRRLGLELSAGFQQSDVGRIEVSYWGPFFSPYERLPAGTLERVPIGVAGLWHFRPEGSFRPYVGAGAAYAFLDFEPSEELDGLSARLDGAMGRNADLLPEVQGGGIFVPITRPLRELEGARVELEDSVEWSAIVGAEISLSPRASLVFDLRYTTARESLRIGFDGSDQLGRPVPQGSILVSEYSETVTYGPVEIPQGGLLDLDGDGDYERGMYWIRGGTLDLDGIVTQIGVRVAF